MLTSLLSLSSAGTAATFSEDQLAGLARTYEGIDRPIWVHDLSARCVYRNRLAAGRAATADGHEVFEILDHHGRAIGQLRAGPARVN